MAPWHLHPLPLCPLTLGTFSVGSHVIWLASVSDRFFLGSLLYGLASRFGSFSFGLLFIWIASFLGPVSFGLLLCWLHFILAPFFFGALLFWLCPDSLLHLCFWIVAIINRLRFHNDLSPTRVSQKPVAQTPRRSSTCGNLIYQAIDSRKGIINRLRFHNDLSPTRVSQNPVS